MKALAITLLTLLAFQTVRNIPIICDPDKSTTTKCILMSIVLTETFLLKVDCTLDEYTIEGTNVNISCLNSSKDQMCMVQILEYCNESNTDFKFE